VSEGPSASARRPWLRVLPLVVLVAASLALLASGVADRLTLDALLASRASLKAAVAADPLRCVALAAAAYIGAVILSVPLSPFMTMFCGFLFGWAAGAVVGVLSATTGATIVFTLGRATVADLLRQRGGVRLQRLAAGFMRDAFSYILFLRLLPIFPFWLTNLAPAAFGVRLPTFVAATFLGLVPGALAYAITGAGIDGVVAAHEAARAACLAAGEGTGDGGCAATLTWRALVTPEMLGGLACLGALALAPVVARRLRRRRAAPALDGTRYGG
jgi:uncharacterized membrane protein YdjX (TVP38/TMEM64 family)